MTRIIAALVFALSTPAFAETAEEIMDKARAARQVDNSIQSVKMIIVSKLRATMSPTHCIAHPALASSIGQK